MKNYSSSQGRFDTDLRFRGPDGEWDGSIVAGDDTDIPLPIATPSAGGATSWTITPSGGLTVAGSAAQVRGKVFAASGGVTIAGSAAQLRGRVYAPTGGVTIAGTAPATFVRTGIFAPSGGVVIGGSAPITFTAFGAVQPGNRTKRITQRVFGHRGFETWRMALQ